MPFKEALVPHMKAPESHKDANMPLKEAPKAHKNATCLSRRHLRHTRTHRVSQGGTCAPHSQAGCFPGDIILHNILVEQSAKTVIKAGAASQNHLMLLLLPVTGVPSLTVDGMD